MPRARKALTKTPIETSRDSISPELYINRELSWIEFNKRVLHEASNPAHPLLERVKFIAIFSSNLDEFFMIRVSGLEKQVEAGNDTLSFDGLSPMQQLLEIRQRTIEMLSERSRLFYEELIPQLAEAGISFAKYEQLPETYKQALNNFFDEQIFPVLTPLAFDPGHPFPFVSNLSLSLAVQLRGSSDDSLRFARVKVPDGLSRLIRLDKIKGIKLPKGKIIYVWLEDLIAGNIQKLFPNVPVISVHPFRVTRDADIEIEEDEAGDLLASISQGLRQRRYGNVVKMDVNPGIPDYIKQVLMENLEIEERKVYEIPGILGLSSLMEMMSIDRPDLKDVPFVPRNPFLAQEDENMFELLKHRDMLLHHPYDSFQPVIDFINCAAQDPDVLAIKQTLYRVGSKSPIVQALIEAAERGKQVAVLVELKARFDEENNIVWARALEKAGAHVVYGLLGLKTHAKMLLVVRREADGLRRYVHLSTGNYNAATAKIYTDYSLFTSNLEIAADISEIFNYLTGYSRQDTYRRIVVAPLNMRKWILEMIEREIACHKKYGNGHIMFKLNALVDPQVISALYRASQAGVWIDLIVRGICSLRPMLKGVSENIRVISIVGRFLEHSRVFYFYNNGEEEIYLGSADMMQRNLDRRVEIIFPVLENSFKKSIKHGLETMLQDNVQSWSLYPDGTYMKTVREGEPVNSQIVFLQQQHIVY
ncbi:MAG: polyphosphate kinase 1 [Candidatus Thermochlorobacter aerophilum]|jgi:polyphosphate kinase|uniref:Polyphosphate kinase n=1 Tax=Candidatus Thermochlorobacter aerophilus TaxID=1868324 RepID=A0A395M340_9BACT|nr:MAG: polyphosphate kinase 1 [Candidatus Thermochlorobacter aerophilum]